MRRGDLLVALVAGAPPTSLFVAWLIGLLAHHLRAKFRAGMVVGQVVLVLLNGCLIGSAALSAYRGYVGYNLFHPYGWIWFFGIVWGLLLTLLYVLGLERKGVLDLIFGD